MKQILTFLIATLLYSSASHALLTITFTESGSDVVVTSSGSVDVSGLSASNSTVAFLSGGRIKGTAYVDTLEFGSGGRAINYYTGVHSSVRFITPIFSELLTGVASGDIVGILTGDAISSALKLPAGYVSGDPISGSATWVDQSFSSLRLLSGTHIIDLPNDEVRIIIGPADTTNPTLQSSTPQDNVTGVSVGTPTLSLTFDEPVTAQSGLISIHKTSDDSQVNSRSVTGSTGSGTSTINISFENALEPDTEYYVLIPATAFDDAVGNSYAGITSTTALSFTTAVGDTPEPVRSYIGTLPSGAIGTLSFTTIDAGCTFSSTPQFSDTVTPAPPSTVLLVDGVVSFTINACAVGATVELTMDYGSALPIGSNYWKAGTPWYRLPASISGSVVTFSITDGGTGDTDGTANGTIVDPGGVATGSIVVTSTSATTANPVPTSPQWALIILGLLMAGVGVVGYKRRLVM